MLSAFKQLFTFLQGQRRRINTRDILQAICDWWATDWTVLLYLKKSGLLPSVQEIPDAKRCAHFSQLIATIWCVWNAFSLLCKLSRDDILVFSLPVEFQICWNYSHWGVCGNRSQRSTDCVQESWSACFGANIWDFLLYGEVSNFFKCKKKNLDRRKWIYLGKGIVILNKASTTFFFSFKKSSWWSEFLAALPQTV